MRRFIPFIVFAVLAVFFYVGLSLNPREVPSPFIGKPAPAFSLPVIGEPGRSFGPEQMRGRVWLLNVWAPWCVACRQEHPYLMELNRTGAVPIVGLNWKDKDREAEALLTRVGNDYGVTGTPETYVIDRAGIVRLKHISPITPEVWKEKFEPLLKELSK